MNKNDVNSWIRPVSRDGTLIKKSAGGGRRIRRHCNNRHATPLRFRGRSLIELPEVLIAKLSPGRADPSRALAKTAS